MDIARRSRRLIGTISALVLAVVPLTVVFMLVTGLSGQAAARGVEQSAAGSGEQITGGGLGVRTFEFDVVRQRDGRVTGEAHVINPVIGSDRVYALDCLNVFAGVNGNPMAAWGGVLVSAEDPSLIGRRGLAVVQDNREGQALPDRMTLGVLLNDTPCTFFTDEASVLTVFPRGLTDISDGNIQVRT